MEVIVAVQSGALLRALRVQLKRIVPARRGGDYNEVLVAAVAAVLKQIQCPETVHRTGT
jgi:hypothetical protein